MKTVLENYYEILGINKSATPEEIKAAYRAMAKKYHPDINEAANAGVFFRMIQEAYETLGDPVKRQAYDGEGQPIRRENEQEKRRSEYTYYTSYTSNENTTRRREKQGFWRYVWKTIKLILKVILVILMPLLWLLKIVLRLASAIASVVAGFVLVIAVIGLIIGIIMALTGNLGWPVMIVFAVIGGICVLASRFIGYICGPYENLVERISFFIRYG